MDGGERRWRRRLRREDVEGVALRGLGADSGKLAELVDEACHGFGEAGRHKGRV
jgi:hypothetical protein